jgi:guanylate kinase
MASGQNKIIIVAAPSGSGKTSVVKYLLKTFPEQLAFSVSCATRNPRSYEKDGVDYYFIPVEKFKQHIDNHDFAEWEMVYEGKYYGTLKSELHRIWQFHKTPLLDVDVRGGINIKKQYPEQALSLFVQPPSIDELKKRLVARGTETPETLKARIEKASYELSFKEQFDKVILNDSLQAACEQAAALVRDFLLH